MRYFDRLGFVLVRPVQCKAEDDDEGDWEVSYTALTTYWPDGKPRLKLHVDVVALQDDSERLNRFDGG
jgi:hypothetical protein